MRLTLITLLFSTSIIAMEWKYLPLEIYRIGNTEFSDEEVGLMLKRTNQKLLPSKIKILIHSQNSIDFPELAFINDKTLDILISRLPTSDYVKLILVKEDQVYQNESWTYDPLPIDEDSELYRGLIFITEKWANNKDSIYERRGYHPRNDTLLHELGHLLGGVVDHTRGPANFMHEDTLLADDTIDKNQGALMRSSPYLVP